MARRKTITAEEARSVIRYEPDTGKFFWTTATEGGGRRHKAGDEAKGWRAGSSRKYMEIKVLEHKIYLHRLAWLLMTGKMPKKLINHIDGDASNNKWENLRQLTVAECQHNRASAQRNSSTGFTGVSRWCGRFRAKIRVGKNRIYLGTFPTPELAHQAYLAAKAKYHPSSIKPL